MVVALPLERWRGGLHITDYKRLLITRSHKLVMTKLFFTNLKLKILLDRLFSWGQYRAIILASSLSLLR
ncbi:hypothetical protein IMAU80009_02964 [Lactiplantibacillus plantarum]|nr:hypothetical protein [Lactiplantibacillus plantarum]